MKMEAYMFPVMVAYGLRSDAMIMIRQSYMRRVMKTAGESSTSSGLGDLFILGKYRLTRINTSTYTLGIAPTLGIELPTGEDRISSDSYDLRYGILLSGRSNSWGIDLNLTYAWNGIALTDNTDIDPGDEIAVEAAVSRQVSVGETADIAVAPVLESSYQKRDADISNGVRIGNTGESLLLLAPGLKLTRGSFILEGLVQFPIWQDHEGSQTKRQTSVLLGVRLMN
ncbi:MAG: transporter [Candidatus Zixiibacteriota bacterium]|nr:MAG: transporter [candidate division Zixibacteria bacterium]